MAGWGDLVGKIAQQFQGRVERLKNEKVSIEKELASFDNKDCTTELARRKAKLITRLNQINEILANNAKD